MTFLFLSKLFNRHFKFIINYGFMCRPAKPLIVQAPTFKNCQFMQHREIIQFLIKFKEITVKRLCDPVLNFMG